MPVLATPVGKTSAIRTTGASAIRSPTAPTAGHATPSSRTSLMIARPPRWRRFPMCAECEAEYHEPSDRRFHAQPNACPVCGPSLELVAPRRLPLTDLHFHRRRFASRRSAGRELSCAGRQDSRSQGSRRLSPRVRRGQRCGGPDLRHRKRRPEKPFALMARD